jgi:hypothetical protein
MSHRSLKIALSVVGCALLSLGSFAAWNKPASLPPLLQGINGDSFRNTDEPGEFNHRLKERYPVGSSEAVLIRELAAEGFKLGRSPNAAIRTATFQRLGGLSDLARRDACVSWTTDDEGRLTSISGHYFVQIS